MNTTMSKVMDFQCVRQETKYGRANGIGVQNIKAVGVNDTKRQSVKLSKLQNRRFQTKSL